MKTDAGGYPLPYMEVETVKPEFLEPLYTLADVAYFLGEPPETVRRWARGKELTRPLITAYDGARGAPIVPFVGLTEAYVASVFRRVRGISAQYLRKVLDRLESEVGLEHALATENLYVHGARLLYDYARDEDETQQLVEIASQNAVFSEVVQKGLERISYSGGFATAFFLPGTADEVLRVSPRVAGGQPITLRGGARLVDLVDRFRGGENPAQIAEDYQVPEADVLAVIRGYYTPRSPVPEAAA